MEIDRMQKKIAHANPPSSLGTCPLVKKSKIPTARLGSFQEHKRGSPEFPSEMLQYEKFVQQTSSSLELV